jgi:pantoate kinase
MKVFVPSHITGFFAAHRDQDPLQSGSVGCGLNMCLGATTSVEKAEVTEILLNGRLSRAPVSRMVVESLALCPVRVDTRLEMPEGAGFGASGAGALGCAYALNACFDLGLTCNQTAAIAHRAEVTCRTGLGDVIAQNTGGLVIRLLPGAPGQGVVDRIPVPPLPVHYVVQGPISTSEVLGDEKTMKSVNRMGERCLKELLRRPTLTEFMRLSRLFATETNLARPWAVDAMEAVEASDGQASMIMLGDAVFSFGGKEALQEFGDVKTTVVSERGASLD